MLVHSMLAAPISFPEPEEKTRKRDGMKVKMGNCQQEP